MVGTAQERLCPPYGFVIASEAKQSRAPGLRLDCFVASAPRNDGLLSAKALRRAGDRPAAARLHPHDGKAAFVGAVGAEPEQAVDAGEAGWIGQHLRRETLAALGSRQCRDQSYRIIGQR